MPIISYDAARKQLRQSNTCPGILRKHKRPCWQGNNEARWRPGQEASLAPPCSNLRSFGSKFTLLKKVLVTFTHFTLNCNGIRVGLGIPQITQARP